MLRVYILLLIDLKKNSLKNLLCKGKEKGEFEITLYLPYLVQPCKLIIIIVTHPLYESRMHWIPDPTPSPPRRTGKDCSDTLVKLVIPRRPPLLRASYQEFLSPHLSPENAGEGGGERLAGQPMKM